MLLPAVTLFSTNFTTFEHILTQLGWISDSVYATVQLQYHHIYHISCSSESSLPQMRSVGCINFGYIQAPQSESAQRKWSSWMLNLSF